MFHQKITEKFKKWATLRTAPPKHQPPLSTDTKIDFLKPYQKMTETDVSEGGIYEMKLGTFQKYQE